MFFLIIICIKLYIHMYKLTIHHRHNFNYYFGMFLMLFFIFNTCI